MQRPESLETGEIYHIYNRGAHKKDLFLDASEKQRFQALMLICNQQQPAHLANLLLKYKGPSFIKLFDEVVPPTEDRLVEMYAYCLMPNHFHFVLRQIKDNGTTKFMKKLCTAYSMFFNAKHQHSGTLFQGRFKSRRVDDEPDLNWLYHYIHLNPLDLLEPNWKVNGLNDKKAAEAYVRSYQWSSLVDHLQPGRPERSILTNDNFATSFDFSDALTVIAEHQDYKGPSFIIEVPTGV